MCCSGTFSGLDNRSAREETLSFVNSIIPRPIDGLQVGICRLRELVGKDWGWVLLAGLVSSGTHTLYADILDFFLSLESPWIFLDYEDLPPFVRSTRLDLPGGPGKNKGRLRCLPACLPVIHQRVRGDPDFTMNDLFRDTHFLSQQAAPAGQLDHRRSNSA